MAARILRRLIHTLLLIGVVASATSVGPLASNGTINTSKSDTQAHHSKATGPVEIPGGVVPTTFTKIKVVIPTPSTIEVIIPTLAAAGNHIILQDGNTDVIDDETADADEDEPPSPGPLLGDEISIKKGGGAAGLRGSGSGSGSGSGGGFRSGGGSSSSRTGGSSSGGSGSSSDVGGGGKGGGSGSGSSKVNNGNPAWFPLGGGIFILPSSSSVKSAACGVQVDGAALVARAMALAFATTMFVFCML
ncbi:hypothetical protein F5Y14DRAFT_127329 [Nemania sp. NC0429]|nr:hypothetical protein F5Y14DRAFT_127329 [Nemania sp. NC0429]